jgi:hypothetical protein
MLAMLLADTCWRIDTLSSALSIPAVTLSVKSVNPASKNEKRKNRPKPVLP